MTRNDYVKLAETFARLRADVLTSVHASRRAAVLDGVTHSTIAVADMLKAQNARFELERFLQNAGVRVVPEPLG